MAKFIGTKRRKPFRSDDPVPWSARHIELLPTNEIVPDSKNARKHSSRQIAALSEGMREFGFSNPILIDELNKIIAGHARWAAAKRLGLRQVPCIRLTHLTAAQKMALAVADNAMTDASVWDDAALRAILLELDEVNFDLSLTGLEPGKIDFHLSENLDGSDPAGILPDFDSDRPAVCRLGDLWRLGRHAILCADALLYESYEALLGDERAAMAITDPPYNVPIQGHVSGLGRHKHREFAMASGEMTPAKFRTFLETGISRLVEWSVDGSMHYIFMDWRHIAGLIDAGALYYTELKGLCVWVKSNAGMGALYRSKHELIAVFKNGAAPHVNNVQLGKHGRNRSNVWECAGANAFGPTRDADLEAHPTCKPVSLIADAIMDCSRRGDLVLDPFAGSGTIILACERSGRRAAAMEIDPLYVDVAIRRWQRVTGEDAVLDGNGRTFAALEQGRSVLALEDHATRIRDDDR